MPFISEEIWQRVAPLAGVQGESIMLAPYPRPEGSDPAVESELAWVTGFILAVRQIRGEMDISPGRSFDVLLANAGVSDRERLERHRRYIHRLANVRQVEVLAPGAPEPESAVALLGAVRLLVPMAGLIDVAAETARLTKRLNKAEQDRARAAAKLANPDFAANAPAAVVAQEQERLATLERDCASLAAQLARVRALHVS